MPKHLLVLAALVTSGCSALRPVSSLDDVRPRAQVQITFAEPRTIQVTRDSVTHELPSVSALRGQVESVRPDTLVVRLGRLDSNVPVTLPRNASYVHVAEPRAQVSTWRTTPGTWIALILVSVVGYQLLTFELGGM